MGRSAIVAWVGLTVGVSLLTLPAWAQQGPVDEITFLTLLPALRTAPAPPWVRAGVRLTYFSASASVAAVGRVLVEDSNGDWQDLQTGKKYREQEIRGLGGAGYTRVSVVHLDQALAALDFRAYTFSGGLSGPLVFLGASGAVGLPGAGLDWWLHPGVLATAVGTQVPGLSVVRMRYPLGGRTYNAIRVQITSAASFQAWVYDEETGILLRSSASGGGSQVLVAPVNPQGGPISRVQQGTQLVINTIVDVRTPRIPWATIPAPGWFASLRFMRFEGRSTAVVPGAGPMAIPLAATLERQFAGPLWGKYLNTYFQPSPVGGPPDTSQVIRVFGPAQYGGLWVAPSILAQLRPGEVLDQDPVTGVVVRVTADGRQGANVIALTEANNGHTFTAGYDRESGMLVATTLTNRVLNTQADFRLVERR